MSLDHGTLARIDRRILAQLDGEGRPQLAKIPVSDATWDIWRRYCRLAGISMGQGLALLIAHELATEIDGAAPVDHVLGDTVGAHIAALEESVADQKRHLDVARARLRERDQLIRSLQQELRVVQAELAARAIPVPASPLRVGRNDPCPCGSGLKYKFCQAMNHRVGDR